MAAQMSSFRALNELFMEQLAELETDGGARADAQRTYEELVAMLNSSGMQALAEGEGWKKSTALDICEVLYSATPGTTYSDRTADITTFTQPSCAHLGV